MTANERSQPPPLPLTRSQRWAPFLFFAGLAVFVAWLAFFPRMPQPLGISPPGAVGAPCVFRVATGLPCALCGGTRAVRATLHGDLARALYLNSLAVVLLALAALAGLLAAIQALSGRACFPHLKAPSRWILIAAVLFLLLPWTVWHASSALRTPKPELINPKHPVVQWLARNFF